MTRNTAYASPALAARVLTELQREADMDGVVIVSGTDVAARLGVTRMAVHYAIERLVDEGRVRMTGHAGRNLRVLEVGVA